MNTIKIIIIAAKSYGCSIAARSCAGSSHNPAHLAKRGELLAINMIEQHHAATEHRPLVNRLERPCRLEVLWIHHHFEIPRIEFFHAAFEHEATPVDKHEIGQDILDLFHLMGR